MSFTQVLLTLRARIGMVLATFALLTFAAVAITLALPKQYTATASVFVDIKPLDPIAGVVLPGSVLLSSLLATQVDILLSQRVAIAVVKNLKLDQEQTTREEFVDTGGAGSIEVWLADRLLKKLEVRPSRDSSVINIGFTARDRNLAPTIANAFAQAYIDTNLEMKVEPARQYALWFDQRSKVLRDRVEQAQSRLSEHQRKAGIVATDERLDIETARLAELSNQDITLQAQSTESRSRHKVAGAGSVETLSEVLSHSLVQSLKADVIRAEAKLQELEAQLGQNHPQVERAKAELEALRRKLDAEIAKVVSGIGTSNRVNQVRESEIRKRLDAQRDKVMGMKEEREKLILLQMDVESAQKAYDAVAARYIQTSLESQNNQSNVNLLNPAVEPHRHSRPSLLLNTAVGAVLGIMLGIALALMRENYDRRIRSEKDLIAFPELPFLGRISAETEPRRMPWRLLPESKPMLPEGRA
jgi:chain length determinant protein EpsF